MQRLGHALVVCDNDGEDVEIGQLWLTKHGCYQQPAIAVREKGTCCRVKAE